MAVRQFGNTWWGQAWVAALEGRAGLDAARLGRGRTYARHDRVARLEVEAGRVTALVRGSRVLPYRVEVRFHAFDDDEWDRVVRAIAGRAAHAAALLDGDLDPAVLEDVRAVGIDLLPGPGDLSMTCSCPDWGDPCKHAAAVCYLVADALDEDPFVLFALRGRTKDQVLQAIRRQRRADSLAEEAAASAADGSAAAGGPTAVGRSGPSGPFDASHDGAEPASAATAPEDPGMIARDAWARTAAEAPHRRDLPSEPGEPAAWPADPPEGAPFTAAGLTQVAADAARRAWLQLAEDAPSYLTLDPSSDLARLAGDRLAAGDNLTDLGLRSGIPAGHLVLQAAGWRHGGADGVAALDEPLWRPDDDLVEAALEAFDDAGVDPMSVSVRSNRFTTRDVQLRVTADARWWRYEKRGRTWELVEPPTDTPSELLTS